MRYKQRHSVGIPSDVSRIVFLETNLSNVGACALERRYIRWYGRKDTGVGILQNKTDGGDGGDTSLYIDYTKSYRGKGQTYEERFGSQIAEKLRKSRTETNLRRGSRSETTRSRISETRKRKYKEGQLTGSPSQELQTCPHCNKTMTFGNSRRWHFNRCREIKIF